MTTLPPQFKISHITDLAQIPAEHLDEAMESIRMMCAQLFVIQVAMEVTGTKGLKLSDAVPHITITCDGVAKSTAKFPGGAEFVMSKDATLPTPTKDPQ